MKHQSLQPYADVADALWLSAPLERLRERGFRRLAERFPRATIECAVDFVEPLAAAFPEAALEALDRLRAAGINCFSVSWAKARQRGLVRASGAHLGWPTNSGARLPPAAFVSRV